MLTVVRRVVPGSTRPRRRAAAAATGAQQQSTTLYQTSSGATTNSSSSLRQRSFALATSGSAAPPVPTSRPSPSSSPSPSYAPLPSPRWEGVARQSCGARSSKQTRFVGRPSSSCTSSRSITTQTGGAQQEQCRVRGASSAAGAGQGAEMGVTPVSFRERCTSCPPHENYLPCSAASSRFQSSKTPSSLF